VPGSFLLLALVLAAVGVLLAGAAAYVMARALVRPPRMTDGKAAWVLKRLSPGDLGLAYEETAFDVRDEAAGGGKPLRLSAWWIPCPGASGRCAVLLHGYADAKVGAIAWAPTWHALGWNVLALDLRAHGQSGGDLCTGGFFERHDVDAAVNQLRARLPAQTGRVVLFGASFGGAVAAAAAALRDDVDAVVLDSTPPDFAAAAVTHMARLGAPGGPLPRLAVRLAERMTGADFGAVRTTDQVAKLNCPVMVIAPGDDPLLDAAAADAFRAALAARPAGAGPGVYREVPGAAHLMALPADPAAYRARLAAFLESIPPRDAAAGDGKAHHADAPALA
jgi:pimeloyl-ACP methyl ester carboxylesterase